MATTTETAAAPTVAITNASIRRRHDVRSDDVSPLLLKRLSDESLGSRLASGEAAAFDELYRRYVNRLSAYGSHLLGDAASGDDVAQAALMKAYGALRDGRVPDRMRPWLFRIAHNAAIDLVVRRREIPSDDLPERPSHDGESAGALVQALAALPDRQRRVYLLREVHGLRIDETAAELGLNASQVEQALFAARNRLAEHLVFGDRLNCVVVQRLAAGPLITEERRALKTHLRSCAGCRRELGLKGRALGLLPAGAFDWLRALSGWVAGGGAPAVAKVGAVVATATVAAGVPAVVEQASTHRPAHRTPVRATGRPAPAPAAPTAQGAPLRFVFAHPVARAAPVVKQEASHDGSGSDLGERRRETTSHEETSGDGSSRDGSSGDGETLAASAPTGETGRDGGSSSDGGDGSTSGGGDRTAATPAVSSDGGSDGGSGASDGGSGSGDGGSTTTTTTTTTTTPTTTAPTTTSELPTLTTPTVPTTTSSSDDGEGFSSG